VKKDQGDNQEDDRPPICPACGVTMGIRGPNVDPLRLP